MHASNDASFARRPRSGNVIRHRQRTSWVPVSLCLLLCVAGLDAHFGEARAVEAASTGTQGTIYRCVDRGGGVSYQNTGCSPEQRTSAIRRYSAQGIDSALVARSRAIEQEMDRRNRGEGRRVAAARSGARKATPPSACETAKRNRENTLERVGFKRDFALLSRLDNEVWKVCKGF
ncbi:MAG: DUF4124 domain-containing protein [Lysobacter sp.]|nr:MAG: DUF4124 domain-containing protein [Lysobacter sp.]